MKKLLLLLIALPLNAHAANMCVKNDTLLVVLDPNITPTSISYDNNARTWSATFSFGTISGIAGCGSYSALGNKSDIVTQNQNAVSLYDTSTSYYTCACKMLLPVESKWVNGLYNASGTTAACSTLCAGKCRDALSRPAHRRLLFGNVIP